MDTADTAYTCALCEDLYADGPTTKVDGYYCACHHPIYKHRAFEFCPACESHPDPGNYVPCARCQHRLADLTLSVGETSAQPYAACGLPLPGTVSCCHSLCFRPNCQAAFCDLCDEDTLADHMQQYEIRRRAMHFRAESEERTTIWLQRLRSKPKKDAAYFCFLCSCHLRNPTIRVTFQPDRTDIEQTRRRACVPCAAALVDDSHPTMWKKTDLFSFP